MVAEEVPPVTTPGARTPIVRRHRVGVKRSRERPTELASPPAQVRPAFDADPAEADHPPNNGIGGKGGPPQLTAQRPPPTPNTVPLPTYLPPLP